MTAPVTVADIDAVSFTLDAHLELGRGGYVYEYAHPAFPELRVVHAKAHGTALRVREIVVGPEGARTHIPYPPLDAALERAAALINELRAEAAHG